MIRSARVAEPIRETAPEHAHEPQAELVTERADLFLIAVDELAAKLRMLAGGKIANGAYSSTGVVPCVKDCDGGACAGEVMGGRQPGQAGSSNHDACTTHEVVPQQPECHAPIIGA